MSNTITLKIAAIQQETPDAITIQFEKPENFIYQSGQFLTLILNIKGEEVKRSYSFSSSPYTDQNPSITVKKIAGGLVSNYLNFNAYEGMQISALPPLGTFTIVPTLQKRNIVLIAAGSGVTPLFSMAKTILSQEPESKVNLLLANRTEDSIIFKNAIAALKNEQFNAIHTLSKPESTWNGNTERISKENIARFLTQFDLENIQAAEYYLCGPEAMMENVIAGLNDLGVDLNNIKKEKFTAAASNSSTHSVSPSTATTKSTVTATLKNVTYTFEVDENETILEAGKNAGIDMPCACENGVCTACMAFCTAGIIDMEGNDTLNKNEIAKGQVLLCCGYAKSKEINLVYK
jgi:ring-1,2-phenylacetyl-CoA epoxidase subunit PaaE